MSRAVPAVFVALVLSTGLAVAGDVIFTDGFESVGPCSWASEFSACGAGTEMVITLPGDAVTMTLTWVPAGTFWMGSPIDERGRENYEDLHEVTLTQGYWMGKYEVTQEQWEAVMGTTPWADGACPTEGEGADYSAYCVSWNGIAGAGGFIEMLNSHLGTTKFRLPTDAEWERAARAGTQTRFSHGDVLECGDECETCGAHDQFMWWCGNNVPFGTKPVGSKQANGFGLYDMHGNVYEWVQDWWEESLGTSPVTDPTGPATGYYRVHHPSGWYSDARRCRSAPRFRGGPTHRAGNSGFRLARSQ